jgi:pilus assembly protein Flp/PilA
LIVSTHRQRRLNRGQGNTEYIIIVALIAIATIGVITLFGDNIRQLFGVSSDSLAGDDDVANRGASSATTLQEKNMRNFATQNAAYDPGGMNMKGGAGSGANGPSFGAN